MVKSRGFLRVVSHRRAGSETQPVYVGRGEGGGERGGERARARVPQHSQQSGQQRAEQNHRKLYRLEVCRLIYSAEYRGTDKRGGHWPWSWRGLLMQFWGSKGLCEKKSI